MAAIPTTRSRPARLLAAALAAAAAPGCRPAPAPAPGAVPRVVSLAPSLTEAVFAIGAGGLLVGRSSACDYPPEAARVPVAGDFGRPSFERILALRPTMVLEVDLEDETLARRLEEQGIRRVHVACDRVGDIAPAVRRLGALLGRAGRAEALAASIEGGLAARRAAAAGRAGPSVYAEIWNDPLMTVGASSFISEMVALAGGRNVGDESPREYFRVASEWVVARDPEVVLCLYMAPAGGAAAAGVGRRPGWDAVRAVRNGRVFAGLDNDLLLRPGPRVLEGIGVLERCLAGAGEGGP